MVQEHEHASFLVQQPCRIRALASIGAVGSCPATAGRERRFCHDSVVRSRVEQAGFPFLVVWSDATKTPNFCNLTPNGRRCPQIRKAALWVYTRLFIGITPRLKTPSLVEVTRRWHADMLIREGGEYAAVIAAEHLGLPHATVSFAAALKTMNVFERGCRATGPDSFDVGFIAGPGLNALYRYLYLAYSPPGFSMQEVGGLAAGALPATTHLIRPQLFDAGDTEQLPIGSRTCLHSRRSMSRWARK